MHVGQTRVCEQVCACKTCSGWYITTSSEPGVQLECTLSKSILATLKRVITVRYSGVVRMQEAGAAMPACPAEPTCQCGSGLQQQGLAAAAAMGR